MAHSQALSAPRGVAFAFNPADLTLIVDTKDRVPGIPFPIEFADWTMLSIDVPPREPR